MTNNGAKSTALKCGGSYTIPVGYHNGNGKITANSLASQTSATATASDIASGKTAWVNGSKLVGTMSGGYKYASGTVSSLSIAGNNRLALASTGLGKITVMQIIAIFTPSNDYYNDTPYYPLFTVNNDANGLSGMILLSDNVYCDMVYSGGMWMHLKTDFAISLSHINGTIYANASGKIRISDVSSMKWIIFYT